MKTSSLINPWPWILLPARMVMFAGVQALFALGFFLTGYPKAWAESAAWWPCVVTIVNLVNIFLLIRLFQRERKSYWNLFHIQRAQIKSDLVVLLGVLVISGPIAFLPNVLSAQWLFGDQETALNLFIRPLPDWAVYASLILFPVSIGLAELPNYFGYIQPRLELQTGKPWLAITLASFFLAFQHTTLPLIFDQSFLLWRLVMFIPFAFLLGLVLRWRPSLLPYLVVVHGLLDLSTAALLIRAIY